MCDIGTNVHHMSTFFVDGAEEVDSNVLQDCH
jgi:hypothetical protein